MIFAGGQGYLDDLPVNQVGAFEKGLLGGAALQARRHPHRRSPPRRRCSDDLRAKLKAAIDAFKKTFAA